MFTGLIEDIGKVRKISRSGASARLEVETSLAVEEIALGDSVSVNGACLTVVETGSRMLSFDVSPETLERTGIGGLRPGSHANLERALKLGDRLGGHIVSGHIDCVASVFSRLEVSGNHVFEFRMPKEFLRYIVEKGSVAIDGISLTVNAVSDDGFSVNIIPHTVRMTNLQYRKPGDGVNIETDILGKYVERLISARVSNEKSGVTMELLAKSGFL